MGLALIWQGAPVGLRHRQGLRRPLKRRMRRAAMGPSTPHPDPGATLASTTGTSRRQYRTRRSPRGKSVGSGQQYFAAAAGANCVDGRFCARDRKQFLKNQR
jgi:hypothetical protein